MGPSCSQILPEIEVTFSALQSAVSCGELRGDREVVLREGVLREGVLREWVLREGVLKEEKDAVFWLFLHCCCASSSLSSHPQWSRSHSVSLLTLP